MAYCVELRMERRCKSLRKDGKPCKGYAVWGGENCIFHGGEPDVANTGRTGDPTVTAEPTAKVADTCFHTSWVAAGFVSTRCGG